jgi:hypothetical protein
MHHTVRKCSSPLSEGDELLLGQTTLMFRTEDFEDRESALSHYKKVGERARQTRLE